MTTLRFNSLGEHRQPFIASAAGLVFRDVEGRQDATMADARAEAMAAAKVRPETPRSVARFFEVAGDGGKHFEEQDDTYYRRLLGWGLAEKERERLRAAPDSSRPSSARSFRDK